MTNPRILIALALLSLVLLPGCATLSGPSPQARSQAAGRVLEVYGMRAMFRQVAPVINRSLKMNLPSSVSPAERERLHRAVTRTYAPDVLLAAMQQRLVGMARAEGGPGVLLQAAGKLSTELVHDMIALERKAGTQAFAVGFRKFLRQPIEKEGKQRLKVTRTLLYRMRLVDLQVAFNLGMMRGMIAARNALPGQAGETGAATIKRMLQQTERTLRMQMTQQLPIMLAYAYRSVSDAKLQRYAALHGSEPVAWVNRAIPGIVAAVLRNATRELAETYRALARGEV